MVIESVFYWGMGFHLPIYVEPVAEPEVEYPTWAERPQTRGECLKGGSNEERPCPWITCKWHLYVEFSDHGREEIDVATMKHSCLLDIADDGGMTLEEIGEMMKLTRERIRQIEAVALKKLEKRGYSLKQYLLEE